MTAKEVYISCLGYVNSWPNMFIDRLNSTLKDPALRRTNHFYTIPADAYLEGV